MNLERMKGGLPLSVEIDEMVGNQEEFMANRLEAGSKNIISNITASLRSAFTYKMSKFCSQSDDSCFSNKNRVVTN